MQARRRAQPARERALSRNNCQSTFLSACKTGLLQVCYRITARYLAHSLVTDPFITSAVTSERAVALLRCTVVEHLAFAFAVRFVSPGKSLRAGSELDRHAAADEMRADSVKNTRSVGESLSDRRTRNCPLIDMITSRWHLHHGRATCSDRLLWRQPMMEVLTDGDVSFLNTRSEIIGYRSAFKRARAQERLRRRAEACRKQTGK